MSDWLVGSFERGENPAVVESERRSIVVDDVTLELVVRGFFLLAVRHELTKCVQLTQHTGKCP